MKWLISFIIFVAITVLWMIYRAEQNEISAESASPISGRIIDVDGRKVHVKIDGTGPPIMLIHGASGNLRDMTMGLAPAISDRFTTIAVDRPGLGYTPPIGNKGATLKQQADLFAGLARKLGYDKIYVLGQSYGGAVALKMALEYPDLVAGLVLISTPSNVWDTGLSTLYKINANPISGPILRLIVAAFPPKKLVDDSLVEIFAPQLVPENYADMVGTGLTLRQVTQKSNALQVAALKEEIRAMVPRYGEIMMPVEAIHGTKDIIVPYEIHTKKLAHQIKGIEVTVLQNVGHMPHHTNLKDVVAVIDRLQQRAGLKTGQ
ncbi:MAG: alpha/beta hydrolase [Alphaproteobacteria bacterium]|nr:alpha/beta hydrolase [Alphaproteobacteria bacterium]